MGPKDQEQEVEERSAERRHRSKSEREKERDPNRLRKTRPKVIDPKTGEVVRSSHRRKKEKESEKSSEKGSEPSASMADLVPELSRTALAPGAISKSSLPYPSFNKTYSKEAVSREDVRLLAANKPNPYTPDSTDLGSPEKSKTKSSENVAPKSSTFPRDGRPPSPPETEFSQQRKGSASRMPKVYEESELEARPESRNSWFGRLAGKEQIKETTTRSKVSTKSKSSKASTATKSPHLQGGASVDDLRVRDSGIGSAVDSNVTSVAPKRDQERKGSFSKRPPVLDTDSSPDSGEDSSPRTPTQTPQFPPPSAASTKPTPAPFMHFEARDSASSAYDSPQPPPPPPPPNVPINVPRVDYLMQNGGLLRPVPKTLLSAAPAHPSQHSGPREAAQIPSEVEKIFGPFYGVLDQYEAVINKNGSLAVATGYRSVARRLLDRLENVFNRDLSCEGCTCVMCQHPDFTSHEGSRGLGWGEVLEWVSGRRELPVWPAFDFATLGVRAGEELSSGLGITGGGGPERPRSPIKMDPDIDEQFREHYLAQSKKTKHAVDKWLSSCPQTAATPPQEVDDETLSFAILTHLDQYERPIFNALVSGSTIVQPISRAPQPKPRSEFMVKTVHSIRRLYRLPHPPRDPEAAIYLLKHPNLHNLLATMSSINSSEWEILTSGRFDGFLWSGADDVTNPPSRGSTPADGVPVRGPMSPSLRQANPSRNNTPFSPSIGGFQSRGHTPFAQTRQPVSNDEETEIAVLAEVEREIYLGMEALEDAFEGLHRKAEMVRRALRERGAGLSMSLQSRQPAPDIISAGTPGFPPSGLGPGYERQNWGEGSEMLSESDWEPESELMSELAPDDSASNISSSRHRRPKRRTERRTPALVEEEEED